MLIILRVFSFLCPQIRFNDAAGPSESKGIRCFIGFTYAQSYRGSCFCVPVVPTFRLQAVGKQLTLVLVKGIAIREAAIRFGVPKSTLGDRISGRVLVGSTSGPKPYINIEEEEELVRFLLRCSAIWYPKSRQEVLAIVTRMLERKGIGACATSGWWQSFCRRHPNLTLRAPASLSKARHYASDPEIVKRYPDLLEQTMVDKVTGGA